MDSGTPAPDTAITSEPVAPVAASSVTPDSLGWSAIIAPTWILVLMLAWPVLTYQLLNLIVGLSDQFLAGWFIPSNQVAYQAAQTTGNYLAWFISSYTVLISVGSTALVSRFVGARDWPLAIHATNQSVVLGVTLGLIGSALGLVGVDQLVVWLQLQGETAGFAADYLRPLF